MTPLTTAQLVAATAERTAFGERIQLGEDGLAHGRLCGIDFISDYQAIFDVGTRGVPQSLSADAHSADRFGDDIGHQGIIRLVAGAGADNPFDTLQDDQEVIALDRLSRAVHAINFFGAQRSGLLFLKVHESLLKSVRYDHGRHFSQILVSFGLNPSRVVIELPEAAVAHRTFLGYLTKSYQTYGFKVAGNLPNAGHIMQVSGMARLDFVKIDANAALRQSLVKQLVSYASRLRIPLIFKGVDDDAQFDLLQQYDVRFVQGKLFDEVIAQSVADDRD